MAICKNGKYALSFTVLSVTEQAASHSQKIFQPAADSKTAAEPMPSLDQELGLAADSKCTQQNSKQFLPIHCRLASL